MIDKTIITSMDFPMLIYTEFTVWENLEVKNLHYLGFHFHSLCIKINVLSLIKFHAPMYVICPAMHIFVFSLSKANEKKKEWKRMNEICTFIWHTDVNFESNFADESKVIRVVDCFHFAQHFFILFDSLRLCLCLDGQKSHGKIMIFH